MTCGFRPVTDALRGALHVAGSQHVDEQRLVEGGLLGVAPAQPVASVEVCGTVGVRCLAVSHVGSTLHLPVIPAGDVDSALEVGAGEMVGVGPLLVVGILVGEHEHAQENIVACAHSCDVPEVHHQRRLEVPVVESTHVERGPDGGVPGIPPHLFQNHLVLGEERGQGLADRRVRVVGEHEVEPVVQHVVLAGSRVGHAHGEAVCVAGRLGSPHQPAQLGAWRVRDEFPGHEGEPFFLAREARVPGAGGVRARRGITRHNGQEAGASNDPECINECAGHHVSLGE